MLRTESESTHKQEANRAAPRRAYAEELAMRIRSSRASQLRKPLGTATNGQRGTLVAPSVLQVCSRVHCGQCHVISHGSSIYMHCLQEACILQTSVRDISLIG